MRHALLSPLLSLAVSALASCTLASPPSQPASPTPPRNVLDEHSHAEPKRARVVHVDLDLNLDFAAKRIAGYAELRIERPDPEAPLILDVKGLEIELITGSDGGIRPFQLGEEHDNLGGSLTIRLKPDDELVRIHYSTVPTSEALQWLSPEQTAGGKAPFLFSQGQSVLTRSWIPLQDSPGVRVTYTARVQAPDGLVPVMSADSSERLEDGSSMFRMTSPIPPYLIAIACGDLEFEAISERCGVWADPSIVASAAKELEDTESMIANAEKLFGPYRWGRYDLLILPPAFPFGGMENPCMTFATPTILAGDKSLVSLVAHELAHSWSGNLVTNATWSDFWLNEGSTVYFEARIMEEVFGAERAIMENQLSFNGLKRELEGTSERDSILHIDLKGRHPDDGFSGIPYNKGALFLRRLEEVFGRADFDRFLRAWFDGHAFQSVTTAEFVSFLGTELLAPKPELAAQVDVEKWIYGSGLPDTAPVVPSSALAQVDAELKTYSSGKSAAGELNTDGWVTGQWLHFLEGLPAELSMEAMSDLDATFGFTGNGNSEILCVWFRLSVKHGYAAADEKLEAFLARVGRAKFLIPLYTALVKVSPERARELYARMRPRYHAVAHANLDRIVGASESAE